MTTEGDIEKASERVESLTRARKFDEALLYCEMCIESWDERFKHEAWDNISIVLSHAGRKDEALDAISKAVELAPDDRSHLFARARLALELDDFELSKRDWTRLLKIERALASGAFVGAARLGRALAHFKLHDRSAALEDLAQIEDDEIMLVNKRLWTAGDLREVVGQASD